MISKRLNLIFNFGQILAITPSFANTNVLLFQKIYSSIILITITCLLAATMYYKNFYRDYNYIKIAVSALLDFNLLLFNYSTVMVIFSKQTQWKQIILNLKIIIKKIERNNNLIFISRNFLMVELMVMFVISLSLYVWMDIYGLWYFKRYSLQSFQLFLLSTYSNFLCLIIDIILNMYKKIENNLYHIIEELSTKRLLLVVNKLDYYLCFLNSSIQTFNSIFSWPITLLISYTGLQILNDSYGIFIKSSFFQNRNNILKEIIADISVVLLIFVSYYFVVS